MEVGKFVQQRAAVKEQEVAFGILFDGDLRRIKEQFHFGLFLFIPQRGDKDGHIKGITVADHGGKSIGLAQGAADVEGLCRLGTGFGGDGVSLLSGDADGITGDPAFKEVV